MQGFCGLYKKANELIKKVRFLKVHIKPFSKLILFLIFSWPVLGFEQTQTDTDENDREYLQVSRDSLENQGQTSQDFFIFTPIDKVFNQKYLETASATNEHFVEPSLSNSNLLQNKSKDLPPTTLMDDCNLELNSLKVDFCNMKAGYGDSLLGFRYDPGRNIYLLELTIVK